MKKSDDDRAALVCILWSITFIAGMFIAAFFARAYGITLMVVSTLVLALYLWYDGRIDHVKDRLDTYIDDCARREKEARRR
ncbi:MAG: hypothetical protein J6I46_02965 [Ruminococcus sp.]|nr:hypothetical protein [Ruminococcus sp.]